MTRPRSETALGASRAWAAATSEVMNRSSTVKAQGLNPSAMPATSTVPSVSAGSRAVMAADGAAGAPRPARTASPRSPTAAPENARMRPGRAKLGFDNQLPLHRRIRPPSAADVTVVLVDPRPGRRERGLPRPLGWGDDVHPQRVDRKLVLPPAVRVEAGIDAGELDGQRAARLGPDLRGREPAHRALDLHDGGPGLGRPARPERGSHEPCGAGRHDCDDEEEGPRFPSPPSRALPFHELGHCVPSFWPPLRPAEPREAASPGGAPGPPF